MREINFPATRFAMTKTELKKCIENGVKERFPKGMDSKHLTFFSKELNMLDEAPDSWSFMLLMGHHFIKDMKNKFPNSISSGRGSICGSLIAYLLKITEVDPVLFNLNPDKFYAYAEFSPIPSLDLDIASSVILHYYEYLQEEYGKNCVFGCTNIIKGRIGIHACAVFVSNVPYYEIGSLYKTHNNLKIINLDRLECEKLGIVRFNLLRSPIVDYIMEHKAKCSDPLDIATLTYHDYKRILIANNLPFEYLKQYVDKFNSSFSNFVLLNSTIHTIKPSDMIHLQKNPIKYEIEMIDSILAESSGKIIYQEQLIDILKFVLKTNAKNADAIRKAIGKNNTKAINNTFSTFVANLSEIGGNATKIIELWNELLRASSKSTVKSHVITNSYDLLQMAYFADKEKK